MRKLTILFVLLSIGSILEAQNDFKFGLQTGATAATFQADVSIANAIASTVPPINEFSHIANFHVGCWFEKRFSPSFALRWEIQRSPGGAKAQDAFDNRLKRYKYFALSSPIILKLTAFQKPLRYPVQLEIGVAANLFLFDYGEAITFGDIQKIEYTRLLGLTKNIDDKWSVSIRYLKGLSPFSTYEAGGVSVNWTNQMYVLSFSRSLFTIQKKKKTATKKRGKKRRKRKRR